MIIYLIGPSGAGKSNAVSLLRSQKLEFSVVDIDNEFRRREFDWNAIKPRLETLHRLPVNEAHIVVNVGAGTQTLDQLRTFLQQALQQAQVRVVLLMAPPEEVIHRQPIPGRWLAEFQNTEYTTRASLYGLATSTIYVTGLAKEVAAQKVVDHINELLANA